MKDLIPIRDGITGLDFLNPIVIIIAGLIPLSVAIFRYIDNSDKKERLGFLYRTANYWLVFSTICVVTAIVIYFVYSYICKIANKKTASVEAVLLYSFFS